MQVKHVVPFSKFRHFAYAISILMIIGVWVGTFVQGGFNLGLDFRPGLSQEFVITGGENINNDGVKAALASSTYKFTSQGIGDASRHAFVVRGSATKDDEAQLKDNPGKLREKILLAAQTALEAKYGKGNVTANPEQSDYIAPSLSSELAWQTMSLTIAAMVVILIYIWIRFKFAYALAAIVALAHDPLFLLGLFGTMQTEFNATMIAAVLTIIGYSLNDTIVVFDRIRENIRLGKETNMFKLIDLSITQTLSRTIVSSLLTIIAVVSIYIFTTGSIKDFSWAMIIGIVVGTYSSIFVAAPLMVLFSGGKPPVEKVKKVEEEPVEA